MFRVESMGKPCSVSEEHFPEGENLARFQGNIFPGGETLPGFRGTFPRAGKPCPVSEEHFPGRENHARFPRNIFQGGESLPRSWGTFSRVGKPCRAARQAFNDNLLAAVIPYSPTSGRIRYAPTVYGEKLTRNDAIHHRTPPTKNGKYVGAYRIRPDVGERGKTAASNPSLFRESPHCLTCSPM